MNITSISNVTNNSNLNFRAKVSQEMQAKLYKQVQMTASKKKLSARLEQQIENIKNWGHSESEIVVCKNYNGNFGLGLRMKGTSGFKYTKPIEHLNGKFELSQFLGLDKHIIELTENSIKFLYKKNGTKSLEISKKWQ